jgi:hypothetical protein
MPATASSRPAVRIGYLPSEWLLGLAIALAAAGLAQIVLGSGYLGGSLVLGATLAAIQGRTG